MHALLMNWCIHTLDVVKKTPPTEKYLKVSPPKDQELQYAQRQSLKSAQICKSYGGNVPQKRDAGQTDVFPESNDDGDAKISFATWGDKQLAVEKAKKAADDYDEEARATSDKIVRDKILGDFKYDWRITRDRTYGSAGSCASATGC
jgi:hypothetical protein